MAKPKRRFCDLSALERVFQLGEIYDKAKTMVDAASVFHVDAVVAGIEDFFLEEGVPEGRFLEVLRMAAKAKKARSTASVERVAALLATLKD